MVLFLFCTYIFTSVDTKSISLVYEVCVDSLLSLSFFKVPGKLERIRLFLISLLKVLVINVPCILHEERIYCTLYYNITSRCSRQGCRFHSSFLSVINCEYLNFTKYIIIHTDKSISTNTQVVLFEVLHLRNQARRRLQKVT